MVKLSGGNSALRLTPKFYTPVSTPEMPFQPFPDREFSLR